jgi:2-dehydro-3-deoxyphosphogluconate aldolase/(4S)-4-hydroxy-2-oxoglutarate aldolase
VTSYADSLLDQVPVIPVVVLHDVEHAVPLARALVDGGLPAIELTLRTPVALDAIARISAEVPEILLGAGTVLDADQARAATEAGARFLVSPGSTTRLRAALRETGLPSLPGVSTVSEVLTLLEEGWTEMKLFPASAVGGVELLKALGSPVPAARFCPTGGIGPQTARAYLDLPNVGCVGGSWITPAALLESQDWSAISDLAREAAALR